MSWRYGLIITVVSVLSAWGSVSLRDALKPRPPKPELIYCTTGAGPIIVDGFEWETGVNPIFSNVWELRWRNAPGASETQSVALQLPFECNPVGGLRT